MPRKVEGDGTSRQSYGTGIDRVPACVGGIVILSALVLIALKLLGFRAMIGVNA